MDVRVREIDGKFYVYEYDEAHHQVLSVGASNPQSGRWFANGHSDGAIKYVGRSYRNKKSALAYARRCKS